MPIKLSRPVLIVSIALVALAGRLATLLAQEAATLPSGNEVLDRYIEVTGGRANYEKLTSRVTHGTIEIPAAGLKGQVITWQSAPERGLIEMNIPGAGEILQGYDGKIVWMNSTVTGPRIVEGPERETMARSLSLGSELHPEEHYQSIENKGIEQVNGKPAYKLVLMTPSGKEETRWYDKESGLPLKIELTTETQMGEVSVVATPGDWQDFGGFKAPRRTVQKTAQQEIVLTIEKIEHNVAIPPEKLEVPPEVKALLTRKATAPATQPR